VEEAMTQYPKRLIEVDLPIARISAHARREKSIRHGHISTLHIWWARRPLAACRAVICAALWPDPADPLCPESFRETARGLMKSWAADHGKLQGPESFQRCLQAKQFPKLMDNNHRLRTALLDFIADFANWDNSIVPAYLETSRALTQAAHESLGGAPGTRPLVVDPFAGGGSIPLEVLRVGADAFASDLNPIPVLLSKVVLDYIPRYGQRLADEVRKWGEWIKCEAVKELGQFYAKDPDGATPVAYLWARKIRCEGPGCGEEVPLIRSLWLAKKNDRSVALQLTPNDSVMRLDLRIIIRRSDGWVDQANPETRLENPRFDGTVRRGSATCPRCGYTTPVSGVRQQLKVRRGGSNDARLLCIVTQRADAPSVAYRLAVAADQAAFEHATRRFESFQVRNVGPVSVVPDEPTPAGGGSGAGRAFSQRHYGMDDFRDLFNSRQLFALSTFVNLIQAVGDNVSREEGVDFAAAVCSVLSSALGKLTDYLSTLCVWRTARSCVAHTFSRQAIPITWDFGEMNPFAGSAGDWDEACRYLGLLIEQIGAARHGPATTQRTNALTLPLPDDAATGFITDPPYYDAVPYADLSDYFYVWHKRTLRAFHPDLFADGLTPKADECIVDEVKGKDSAYFERSMQQAMAEGRRVLSPAGVAVVVFAHKSTGGWEALLQAMVDAGWIVTGSWPIDTERPGRLRANDSAALASSVHLVCRPRENPDGSLRTDDIGDWRDVLAELPKRIHEWMPRLAEEGVVGADAIFACLGPALEIFSRYSRVEKSSGDTVPLREYLEHVWAAVSNEALSMMFKDADAAGLEPDARLTAMWLWTLGSAAAPAVNGKGTRAGDPDDEPENDEDEAPASKPTKDRGFVLEFDAARKIAQGLGIHLEKSPSIVEIKGDKTRLLPVAERTKYLFGKDAADAPATKRKPKKKDKQLSLFETLQEADAETATPTPEFTAPQPGSTVLDRVHQAMILFAAGRGESLKRFLVDEGIGKDARFWKLAQSLSALYPAGIDEKRWVDGVLARKKGLGL
jgi:putative DNA methylase